MDESIADIPPHLVAEARSFVPRFCATCGAYNDTPGNELRHIHWHTNTSFDEERYAKKDQIWRRVTGRI